MTIDDARLLRWRMHAQLPATAPPDGPRAVAVAAGRAAGVQAQDEAAARLGLRARGVRSPARVEAAYADGSVVASWLMRGTLHLVPAADLRGLLGVFGARNLAAGARRRRELGLTEEVCARAVEVIPEVLHTPLDRADLIAALIERGVAVDRGGQAPAHLMAYAAARGVLCRSGELAPRRPGYVLLDGPPPEPAGEAELAGLARRHLAAFGPAGAEDLAAWSGLPRALCRRALAGAGLPEVAPGLFADPRSEPAAGPPHVRLLGAYDGYLLGYRDRALMLDPAYAKRINAGAG